MRPPRARFGTVLLRWLFDLLYHELAWAYDPVSALVSGGRWRDWQRVALPFLVGQRVLDVGCGPGHLLRDLIDAGYIAFGLELSPQMLRRAGHLLASQGRPGRLVGGDARAMPFSDEAFDTLVLTFPPPFIRDPTFWSEAARVVKPGGRIILVEGARSNARIWPGIVERAWGWLAGFGEPREGEVSAGAVPARRISTTTPRGTVWLIVAEVPSRSGRE